MYFKILFKYKRKVFWLLLLACGLQLFAFYKQGAVATPFFNFGMYSDKMMPLPVYNVYKVYVNDVLLTADNYSIQEWDKIYVPVYMFLGKDSVNNAVLDVQYRLLHKMHLDSGLVREQLFTNPGFGVQAFQGWYKSYLSGFVGMHVDDLKIVKQQYSWNGSVLQPGDSALLFH